MKTTFVGVCTRKSLQAEQSQCFVKQKEKKSKHKQIPRNTEVQKHFETQTSGKEKNVGFNTKGKKVVWKGDREQR